MSIWNSINEPVQALNADDDAANYRAEGEPTVGIDVAIALGYHDHIRLAVWDDQRAVHIDAVLSPEAARRLRDMLDAAL
jgi:hypothetical protein